MHFSGADLWLGIVPVFGTAIAVLIAWLVWFPGRRSVWETSRTMTLFAGLIATSINALLLYSWIAFRLIAGESPSVWEMRTDAGNFGTPLIYISLASAIAGKGRARLPVAISALIGFLFWIPIVIL